MRIFLVLFAALSFLGGFIILGSAKSALHEIEAFILFLIFAILTTGSAILGAVSTASKRLEEEAESIADTAKLQVEMLRGIWAEASNARVRATQAEPKKPEAKPASQPAPPPPPSEAPPAERYYVSSNGTDSGPYTIEQLVELRRTGQIKDDDLILREGEPDWKPAREFPEIG